MAEHLKIRSFDSPDEVRPFADKGGASIVHVGDATVGLLTFEPGWRWSTHVKPIAGSAACETHHLGYVLSGRMQIEMLDGTSGEIGPGNVVEILPGHDAWVLGGERCLFVDFGSLATYARRG